MLRTHLASTLLAVLTLGAASTGSALARPTASAVPPSQKLATLGSSHEAYSSPRLTSSPIQLVQAQRPLTGEQTVLPVIGQANGPAGVAWLRVRLPGRPNGRTGWIERPGTLASTTSWHITVNTAKRQVRVYDHGRLLRTFEAVVGKPSTPTPTGQFFVEEAVQLQPTDVGAPFALALSARSNVLQEFDGGPGQVALHGLDNVGGTPGTAVSHGCIRLTDDTMKWLVLRIAPGTPVTITN